MNRPTDEDFNAVRKNIKGVAANLFEIKRLYCELPGRNNIEVPGEVTANLTLAYRHLEDASMRLGKAIQAYDGGVSVYDKSTTVGA